jgi:pyruvate/2-oxoglutarate dehydrogenase complex dihydrolipoamide acyltransferase (E2) component
MRRAIADEMVRSAREAPHATTMHEVDVTRLVTWREQHRAAFRALHGVDISYLAFVVAAACGALRDFPVLNSCWSEEGIIVKRQINVGIAVALQDGLIVPVIARADELSLVGIARAIADLAARAREGRLSPAEVRNGTFGISNVGMYGSILAVPVLYQSQAAILAVGAITKRVIVLPDDALAIRSMLYLSLSFDHRITDGMTACQFMQNLCTRLADMNPDSL